MSTTSTSTTQQNHHHSQKTTSTFKPNKSAKLPNGKKYQGGEEPDITKDEFERIAEALKKEEFRKLFLDYIDEIQDPDNRKLYEEEIKQIEAERGVDVCFIHPLPGFVIKTSQDGSQKCFINCAKSEHVAKPTNQLCLDPNTGTRGLSWSIPMAQAPPRDDLDNKNKRCRVYDVVFHPDALYLAGRNASFHKCLVETALDAVEREYQVKLDRINLKFPKLQFKGIARPTVIRKLAKDPPAECNEPHPLDDIYPAKPGPNDGQPTVLPLKTIECRNTTRKSSDFCTPKYTIKHRHDVDLTEYTNELDAKLHVSTPRELVIDIEMPLLNSSSECQLDVTEKTLFLLSDRVGAKYRLNIDLPFKVKDKEGSAKFDVDTRRLIITLPVLRSTIEKDREMHESLLHLCREDSGVESDVREELLSINRESPVDEISSLNIEKSFNDPNDEISLKEEALKHVQNEEEDFLHSNIGYQFPLKFDCNVLDKTMSWVLHVRNVQEQSIVIKRYDNALHLKFVSVGSGYYPSHYSFFVKLSPVEKEAKIVDSDAEAWENNVVLNLHLNTNAESIAGYSAGIDRDNLQEYMIQENFKVAHNSRKRQKDQEKLPIDISIERSECEKTLEIEIKARPAEFSTSNANTTEDEDINSVAIESIANQQQQKKVNKKQKRKNKQRRSLSESACDDIKAFQEQQQQQQKLQQNVTPTMANEASEQKHEENADDADDDDDEDSSPDRTLKSLKSLHPISLSMNVPLVKGGIKDSNISVLTTQQRKQRSFSESRDSVISFSSGSSSYKGILKHNSRYDPRPSISDSCDSIDEFSSPAYSTSVDGVFTSLSFSHSFSDIPEENVVGLSESCKKTVRFSEVIKKQVFRLDSSILGQRKKNQKRRDRKQRALQRRLSEGDSGDYEDNKPMSALPTTTTADYYLKSKNNQLYAANNCKNGNTSKHKTLEKKSNKMRARLESESSSDVDNHKNSMIFEMDM